MNKNITIKEVARVAGVSIATVSYVLNGTSSVSEQTRARVMEVATALGYRTNVRGRSLRAQESRIIGYSWHHLPADHWHPILDRFLYSMAEAAEGQGYHILTFTSSPTDLSSQPYEELILSGQVDGFILSDTNHDDERIRYLIDQGFPFVAFGQANPEWDFPYVDVDGADGIRQSMEHLLGLGHRRIGLIAWPTASLSGDARCVGYQQAMTAAGIAVDPGWIVRTQHAEPSGRDAMNALLALPLDRRPTAVMALSDLMAIGACKAIQAAGLEPGRDIAVIGFDDIPLAQYLHPALTTVRQPIDEVGERVVTMLLKLIRGEELEERRIMLSPTLIVRESSGGPLD